MATLANINHPVNPDLGTTVDTTDATQTVAARFPTESDTAYFVDVKVVATETAAHDEVATYWRQACYKNDGGTLTLVGAEREVVTDNESTGGWDVDLAVASEDIYGTGVTVPCIKVLVTGAAATLITWRVVANIIAVK